MTRFFEVLSAFGYQIKYVLFILCALLIHTDFSSGLEKPVFEELPLSYTNPGGSAVQNFRMTRSIEKGYPPSELRFEAFEKAKEIIRSTSQISTLQNQWTERGPINVGGRTRAIMFDPNDPTDKKVWAAGVAGGVWSNEDITNSTSPWQQSDDFMENLAISSLAYDPKATNTFYAGTGEGWQNIDAIRGAGIFISDDGGQNWTQLQSTVDMNFNYVQKVVVTSQGTILAAVKSLFFDGSGVFRSVDKGLNWIKVINGPGADIEIGSDGSIFASIGIFSPGSMHKSIDDGTSWTQLTTIPTGAERIEIAIAPSNPAVIYAVASNDIEAIWLATSNNSGQTWTELNVPTTIGQNCQPTSEDFGGGQAWYNLILNVHPDNPDNVFLGGIDLHESSDAGSSWNQISYWTGNCLPYVHADQHILTFRPNNSNELLIGNDGGIFYSDDIGIPGTLQFLPRNANYNVTQFYSIALENESQSNYILGGTQDNGTQLFNSLGLNATTEVTGGDGGFCFIDQDQFAVQITSFIGNQYFLSTNGGQSFNELSGDFEKGLFINPSDYDSDLNILYAAGDPDELIRYFDLLVSPSSESMNFSNIGQVSSIQHSERIPGRIYFGTDGFGLFRMDNSHTDNPILQDITANLPSSGYISSMAIGEAEEHMLVTFSNYDIQSVFESQDGGLSWANKEGNLPNMPVRSVVFDPSNNDKALIATEIGLWRTENLNITSPVWIPDNTGLANVRCDMIRVRKSDGVAGVATHGRGIFTANFVNQSLSDFKINNSVSYENESVEFIDLSYLSNNSWEWDFGDGATSELSNSLHEYSEAGIYDVTLTIANGSTTKVVNEAVHILPSLSTSYLESDGGDFENNVDHFSPFSVAGSTFLLGNSTISGKSGTSSGSSAWVLDPESTGYKANSLTYLYTPEFSFSNPGPYSLGFKTKFDLEAGFDGFFLEVSTDRGDSWSKLANNLSPDTWYNIAASSDSRYFTPGEPIFSGSSVNSFLEKTVDLSFLSEKERVSFRFVFISDETENKAGLVIDDFVINGPTSPDFIASEIAVCLGESVVFTNQSSGDITSYEWNFGEDSTPQTASGEGPHNVNYSAAGEKTVILTINGTISKSKPGVVTVNPTPSQIDAQPISTSICFGEDAEITFGDLEDKVRYKLIDVQSQQEVLTFEKGESSELTLSFDGLETNITYKIQAEFILTGCLTDMDIMPSIVVIPLPSPNIEQNSEGTLAASQGDSYQWYFEGDALPGANQQTFDPDLVGSYSVEITENGCTALSDIFEVIIVGIDDGFINEILAYPNPVNDKLNLVFNVPFVWDYELFILSTDGKIIVKKYIDTRRNNTTEINLSQLRAGMYIIKLKTEFFSVERSIYKKDN